MSRGKTQQGIMDGRHMSEASMAGRNPTCRRGLQGGCHSVTERVVNSWQEQEKLQGLERSTPQFAGVCKAIREQGCPEAGAG